MKQATPPHLLRLLGAPLLALALLSTAQAADRALIMGIADYAGAPLDGVRKDMVSAREIALALGIGPEGVTLRQDRALTLAGLRQTLEMFGRSVGPGDRIFIYFSGHGSRFTDASGTCDAALVTQDLKMLGRREFDALVQPMLSRAAKSVLMLDTCHSAAVMSQTRQNMQDADRPRARFLPPEQDACAAPSNLVRSSGPAAATTVLPNHYLLASAGETEVAIDGGLKDGGYATTAVAQCLAQPAASLDQNGDGLVTFSELRACAQARLDGKIRDQRARTPQFEFLAQTLTGRAGPGGDMPLMGRLAPGPAAGADTTTDARALLNTLHESRDATRTVTLTPSRKEFRIGTDFLEFTISSNRKGYAHLFAVGSSGKIDLLFPNRSDAANLVEPGQALALPRAGWRLRSLGPAGSTALLAVVTDGPDWMGEAGAQLRPFSRIDNRAGAVQELARKLLMASRCTGGGSAPHATSPQRDFSVESDGCSARFGAARADVVEIGAN